MRKIIITESQYDRLQHFSDRYKERLSVIDLLPRDRQKIDIRIRDMLTTSFPKRLNIAYRISNLPPNENSKQYYVQNGTPYYRFKDTKGNLFIGDELWAIIKDDNFVTFLVRRSAETRNRKSAANNFKVDAVIYGSRDLEALKKRYKPIQV